MPDVTLAKTGPGRVYYRVGITYAPNQTHLPALDVGFIVRRTYTAIDDPGDVVRTADGWKIRLGALASNDGPAHFTGSASAKFHTRAREPGKSQAERRLEIHIIYPSDWGGVTLP